MDLVYSTQDGDSLASGVYAIINRTNGKRYIGSTQCFRTRWRTHVTALKHGRHRNADLQQDFAALGIESFGFSIIEFAPVDKLVAIEQQHLDANVHCYNAGQYAIRPALLASKSQCPTCGHLFTRTNFNQRYCNQSCRPPANATLYEKTCPKCSNPFFTPKPTQVYCSHGCRPRGTHRKKPPIIKQCPMCGREFEAKKQSQTYCGNQCRCQSRTKPPMACRLCGEPFYTSNRKRQKFCSKKCQHEGQGYPGNKSATKHGMAKHPLYPIWQAMKNRCRNTSRPDIKKIYYDRGITVCIEWESDFIMFYNWAIAHEWKPGLELDRRDGTKGYSPENCRWVTDHQQAMNTRRKLPTSGYRGVHQLKDRHGNPRQTWAAYFTTPGNLLYLGCYRTPEEAAHCWDAKATEIRGEFAILNFPKEQST